MQGNRDGSWSLRASAYGGSGNGNGGYLPQTTPVFHNYIVKQQQPIRYNFQTQQNLNFPHPQFGGGANVELIRIDKAVNNTRKSLIAAGDNVSSTRVSQSVLAQLQADTWRSLGIWMQDVPSLRQLMALEGKIIAFIHCFIGARGIVTLHDLEVAICQNEFVGCFDDLGLGPLLQHPLVLLYFPSVYCSTAPVKITSEEIISLLDSYLNTYDIDDVKLDEFLDFVAEAKAVTSKEKLGVRIQNLRMYVSFIQDAKRQEGEILKIVLTELHQKYRILSSKKQRQDKDYCGKHTRFNSPSSEENDSADYEVENVKRSDHFSSCPYSSAEEEVKQLGSSSKKRKAESRNHEKSDSPKLLRRGPSKLRRGHVKQKIPKSADDSDAQIFSVNDADFTLSEGALKLFISTWKETCKELSISVKELVTEALEEQIPTEITITNLVAGYNDCTGTRSRANMPNPTKSCSTPVTLAHNSVSTDFSIRNQLHTGALWAAQAQESGKKGEEIAYRYFVAKYGKKALVKWVNEHSETGLPYDLIIENRGGNKEYVEVKATVSTGKDYFNLSVKEWEFANEKGESYVIAHVLLGNSNAILTQQRNLVKLRQDGHLRLLILMPSQRNEVNVAF
ncbi:no vein-like protein [Arabidopsis thaliana]|uniref:No vein-like protein n=1 Tax=Arabidopsis thaliana TaxID=3702 RepID=A0A1P8ARF3_ARATH|nr:no vein-like protein [Arabidopsis thaliana]ANM59242.1 no vein-like protein [Arabidopsis thaliana]|eukprot:NP_001321616.1 no vein-like protein [Arabidopsis thaliana]